MMSLLGKRFVGWSVALIRHSRAVQALQNRCRDGVVVVDMSAPSGLDGHDCLMLRSG